MARTTLHITNIVDLFLLLSSSHGGAYHTSPSPSPSPFWQTRDLERQGNTLENSLRIVADTEEVGVGIMRNLGQQHDQLLGAQKKVKETKAATTEAGKILRGMSRYV